MDRNNINLKEIVLNDKESNRMRKKDALIFIN